MITKAKNVQVQELTEEELTLFLEVENMLMDTFLREVERKAKRGEKIGLCMILFSLIGSVASYLLVI